LSLYLALSHNSKPISQLWSKSAVKKPKLEKVLARADAMRPNIIFTMADDLGISDTGSPAFTTNSWKGSVRSPTLAEVEPLGR
jgi:hypothetical protein